METTKPLCCDSENIAEFLVNLGFFRLSGDKWRHKDFDFPFDFVGVKKDNFIMRLWGIFGIKGYENCQKDFRNLIGIRDQQG